jgi:F-type H+-transporting ATPase subunit b
MANPLNPSGIETSGRAHTRPRGRLLGAASTTPVNAMPIIILGAILIVAGILCNGQGWTTPEMFKGLGLNLALTITNIGVILVWWKGIEYYFYKPLKEAMDARNTELEQTFSEAESLKAQMTQMRSDYEARLAKTEAEAREQIQAQIKEAQALRQTLMAEATQKADDLVRQAEQDIEAERHRVMGELRREVVDLSLRATERLIGKNVDDAANRKLVQEFLDDQTVVR